MKEKSIFEELRKSRLDEAAKELSEEEKEEFEKLVAAEMGEQCYAFGWDGNNLEFEWEVGRDTDYEDSWPYKPPKPYVAGYKISNYSASEIDDGMSTASIYMTVTKDKDVSKASDSEILKWSKAKQEKQAKISSNDNVLRTLAKSQYEFVRKYVAENTNTPTEVLSLLANDESEIVREASVRNNNLSKEDFKN